MSIDLRGMSHVQALELAVAALNHMLSNGIVGPDREQVCKALDVLCVVDLPDKESLGRYE